MKKLVLMLTMLVMMISLVACTPSAKSENALKTDLQAYLNSFEEPYITIEKLEILKRQTDKDAKSDVVYVEIEAGNDDIECVLSYQMNYHLYEQGWDLETVSRHYDGEWNMKPLNGPKQAEADEIVNQKHGGSVFKEKEESLDSGTSTFYYVHDNGKAKHATFSTTYSVDFTFDTETGLWEAGEVEEVGKLYNWDITGIWYPVYNKYFPTTGWYNGYVMTIGEIVGEQVHISITKDGKTYFDDDVAFDNVNGARFTVKTSDSSWDNLNMVISASAIGADSVGTRAGCYFERK